jgi:hypothetical protein
MRAEVGRLARLAARREIGEEAQVMTWNEPSCRTIKLDSGAGLKRTATSMPSSTRSGMRSVLTSSSVISG